MGIGVAMTGSLDINMNETWSIDMKVNFAAWGAADGAGPEGLVGEARFQWPEGRCSLRYTQLQ
jgi:hypothetical protein